MRLRLVFTFIALGLAMASPLSAEAHSPILTVLKSKKKKSVKQKRCAPSEKKTCYPAPKKTPVEQKVTGNL